MNSTWMMKSAFNKPHGSKDTMREKHNCKSVVKHQNTATGTGYKFELKLYVYKTVSLRIRYFSICRNTFEFSIKK